MLSTDIGGSLAERPALDAAEDGVGSLASGEHCDWMRMYRRGYLECNGWKLMGCENVGCTTRETFRRSEGSFRDTKHGPPLTYFTSRFRDTVGERYLGPNTIAAMSMPKGDDRIMARNERRFACATKYYSRC